MADLGFIAFDPGETIGWASWDRDAKPLDYGQIAGRDDLHTFLEALPVAPLVVIIEDYKVFGHKAKQHIGSKVETTRVIGAIEYWAAGQKPKPKIVLQYSNILSIAQMWSKKKMPSNHSQSHWISAYNHGHYYLVNAGLAQIVRD